MVRITAGARGIFPLPQVVHTGTAPNPTSHRTGIFLSALNRPGHLPSLLHTRLCCCAKLFTGKNRTFIQLFKFKRFTLALSACDYIELSLFVVHTDARQLAVLSTACLVSVGA